MVQASVIKTSECEISYRDIGSGPPLLLLQGGGIGATGWSNYGPIADELSQNYRLIIPDMPGYGASKIVKDEGDDFQVLAAKSMAELLDALGIKKAHVFGNSMGGGVALRIAMSWPEKVDKIALMGPFLRGFDRNYFSGPPSGMDLHHAYMKNPSLDAFRDFTRSLAFAPDEIENLEEIVVARYEASIVPEHQEAFKRISYWIPGFDYDASVAKVRQIKHETLIFWGREDRHCNLETAFQFVDALSNSELIMFRDTGHWVQLERRREFLSYINAFLSR